MLVHERLEVVGEYKRGGLKGNSFRARSPSILPVRPIAWVKETVLRRRRPSSRTAQAIVCPARFKRPEYVALARS